MTDPYSENSFVRCEAVKTAYRQTKEGMVVSFAIHPNEMPPELALAPVGTRVLLAVAELRDDATANEAPAAAGTPPLVGVRASVEGTPDVRLRRGHLVSEVPALGDDETFPSPNAAAAVPSTSGEGPGHRSEAARERYRQMDENDAADTIRAKCAPSSRHKSEVARDRYRQMDEGEQAVARAAMLEKNARFHAWIKDVAGTGVDPAQFIRDWCQVKSRTEIASNAQAFQRFHDLEHEVRGFAEQRG